MLRVAYRSAEHPVVQFLERLVCHHRAVVVRPAANDRVELPQDCCDAVAAQGQPRRTQFLDFAENRFLAWFDQQFVPRLAGLGCRVVPDVEAKEVKPLPQVNDAGLLRGKGEPPLAQPPGSLRRPCD